MRKARREGTNYLRIIIIVSVIAILLTVAFVLLKKWEEQRGKASEINTDPTAIEYEGKEYVLKDNIETFLVLGLDKYEGASLSDSYNNNKQADFIMLFVFDNDAQKYTTIHINRDTIVDINVLDVAGNRIDTVKNQIALAHTYGNGKDVSCRNTADAVSALLMGMRVNHYISLTLDSVTIMNNLIGGVEVTVLDDFTGIDDTLIKGEKVTLMGEHALNYVRTRKGLDDSSNSSRMIRQQQYIKAMYEKFQYCVSNDEEFIVDATLKMSDYIISDRSVTRLQELAEKFNSYEFVDISSIEGESKLGENNFIEFYADEGSIKKIVIELFYKPKE